ncbi:hypothetical protein T552_02032 [Pneumocystis carinii B80]|uniref:Dienelactone hydrolase domain-containing protein n=1 Tax=Pneumocystis carinii (strain B80) TaxID=1408658 RepID=A0A0W4ZIG6_PNEC8|nr:hypothetical protein T552_02032 [Pneumocystis carinii B80]KTW28173.1 hypothetical protein T552_02032 [Pneumocystis carinii B80]
MPFTNSPCCTLLPVLSDYTPKGFMTKVSNLDAYVIGNNKKRTLVCVYDIFGFWPQTKQCVDLLSSGLDARIIMPDFFKKKPYPIDRFPPDTPEKRKEFSDFISGPADPEKNLEVLGSIIKEVKQDETESLGVLGFCWGGKLSVLGGGHFGDELKSVAMIHPAMVDPKDAANLKVPVCSLLSKDEPVDQCNEFEKIVKTKSFADACIFKTFDTMHHGFMAARSDLTNSENVANFREGVKVLINFFKNTL